MTGEASRLIADAVGVDLLDAEKVMERVNFH